jgi:tRNA U34 5-methylaminomethyl-2-thiouridine-forming methyltransferase MnmC
MTEEAEAIIQADWDVPLEVSPSFILEKKELDFFNYRPPSVRFDLIYFDAFGYRAQSELWDERAFELCAGALVQGGILVTYASKGSVRRAMMASGFEVEKLPGAPGKREMIRAYRK